MARWGVMSGRCASATSEPAGTRQEPGLIIVPRWGQTSSYSGSVIVGTRLNPRRNPRKLKDALYETYTYVRRPAINIYY